MKTTASRASAVSQTRGFGDLLYDKAGSRPSLDLDFAGTSSLRDKVTGENLVDHTRNSSGTFINSEGLVESSYANFLPGSENLSESATYPINHSGTAVLVDNTDGVYTPRGQLAKLLKPNQSGTQPTHPSSGLSYAPRISWNNNLGQSGYTITKSIYAKMQTGGPRYLSHYGWAGANISTVNIKFDLQEGVVHGNQVYYPDTTTSRDRTSYGINDEGGGWYRCWVTITNTSQHPSINWVMTQSGATSADTDFYYDSTSWDTNKGIYIAHPQLNLGQLKDYIPTLDNTLNHSPRFTHERVETGNLKDKTTFLNFDWSLTDIHVEPYAALSPDGKYNAVKIVENTDTYFHQLAAAFNGVTGKKYRISAFFKAGTRDKATLKLYTGSGGYIGLAIYNLANGTVQSTSSGATDAVIDDAGNGWYRCSFTTNTSTVTGAYTMYLGVHEGSYQGENKFIYAWGPQAEEGDGTTTYAPSIDTFTSRNGAATYVDSAGLVKTAKKNFLTYSEDISQWTEREYGGGQITVTNTTHINPTGEAGSYKCNITGGPTSTSVAGGQVWIQANSTTGGETNMTASVYIKAENSSDVGKELTYWANDTQGSKNYDKVTLTADWQRVTFDNSSGFISSVGEPLNLGVNNGSGTPSTLKTATNTVGFYIWGAQFETGLTATEYVKTTASASGAARYSHDPETLTPTGLYLEPAATNLVSYSEDFTHSTYTKPNTTVVSNHAVAPDGTQTADKLTVLGQGGSYIGAQASITNGTAYTMSVWIKAVDPSNPGFFDLFNQATAPSTQMGKTQAPTEWTRFTLTATATRTGTYYFGINNPPDDYTAEVLAWGLQVEAGSHASSYIPTSGSEVTRAADVYTSTANLTETFEPRGLLIEEARTNLLYYSSNPVNNWSSKGTSTTVTANYATAPDGTNTAVRIQMPATAGTFFKHLQSGFSASTVYTASFWGKSNGQPQIQFTGGPNSIATTFTLSDRWERYTLTFTSSGTAANYGFDNGGTPYAVDALVWGMQVEAGSFATSYIPTTGATAVTRSADIASISGDNFGTYRTNLLTHSNFPRQSLPTSDGIERMIIKPYFGLSPSNKYDSTKFIPNTDSSSLAKRIKWTGYASGSQTTKTLSFYAKAGGLNFIHGRLNTTGVCFNLSNGTTSIGFRDGTVQGTAASASSMEDVGNGWYRCIMTSNVATNISMLYPSNSSTTTHFTSNGIDGIELYGVQTEEGTLTNYIPSTDTFTSRLGNATYVDSNGLIKTNPKNYVKYSQDFDNSYWSISGGTITSNFAEAPDGTQTAAKVTINTGGNTYFGLPNTLNTLTPGKTYTWSIWVKSTGVSSHFTMQANASGASTIYRLAKTPTPTEWTRYSVTFVATSATQQAVYFNNYPDDYSVEALIWGAQVNEGSEPLDYVKTTTVESGAPRYSHDPETLVPTGLYLEPAATNYFGQYPTTGSNSTLTLNADTAPDGSNTAIKVTQDSSSNTTHSVYRTFYNTSSRNWTLSAFVKPIDWYKVYFTFNSNVGAANSYAVFDLSNGTIQSEGNTNVNASIKPYQNGWYRITIHNTGTSNGWRNQQVMFYKDGAGSNGLQFDGDSTSSFLVWGFQIEQGTSEPTSYIYDTGTTMNGITRPADTYTSTATTVLDRDGGNKIAPFNPSEYTFGVEYMVPHKTGYTSANGFINQNTILSVTDGSATQRSEIRHTGSTNGKYRIGHQNGSNIINMLALFNRGNGVYNVQEKGIIGYDGDETRGYASANGVLEVGTNGGITQTTINKILLGARPWDSQVVNSSIQRIYFWKTRLPNTALTNITKL